MCIATGASVRDQTGCVRLIAKTPNPGCSFLIVKKILADARAGEQAAEPTGNADLDVVEGVNGGQGEGHDGEGGEGGGVPNGGAWPDCKVHI